MSGSSDIPGGMGSKPTFMTIGEHAPDKPASGLVWLEDGHERPFKDASEDAHSWLEESGDWVSHNPDDSDDDDKKEDPPELLWI